MKLDNAPKIEQLKTELANFFGLAVQKAKSLQNEWNPADGSPVFTVRGKYTARGWTEWTQGFQFGIQILAFDATGDEELLRTGRDNTLNLMAPHVSHTGVHDHGFNNVSTYGNLRRLALEERTRDGQDLVRLYELALKVSGAVQAARWTGLRDGTGYICSFNGPHSLFSDTARSCRSLVLAHKLGHCLMGENDTKISLLERAVQHLANTSRYNVYFGEGRDMYDVPGRVVHESIFNTNDGRYRCPSTQQGYSPFSTWTRGLAWVILGFAEQLEFFRRLDDEQIEQVGGRQRVEAMLLKTAQVTSDFYIDNTAEDGIPYWDTGAPGLAALGDWREKPAETENDYEPVDSSAAAIASQGLLRLGRLLGEGAGDKYTAAGLKVAQTLLRPPYLSENTDHHGLLLHSVYHRPNGWDHIPDGSKAPHGESSMWGDYHAIELAVYIQRLIENAPYLTFFP